MDFHFNCTDYLHNRSIYAHLSLQNTHSSRAETAADSLMVSPEVPLKVLDIGLKNEKMH
jgi:hypothetical protein